MVCTVDVDSLSELETHQDFNNYKLFTQLVLSDLLYIGVSYNELPEI